jgi:hypothetical protein
MICGGSAQRIVCRIPYEQTTDRPPSITPTAIIKNPDVISKGMKITIPKLDDEKPAR